MKTLLLAAIAALSVSCQAQGQTSSSQTAREVIPLWAGGAPGFENRREEPEKVANSRVSNVHNPTLTVYPPAADKANGAAMVICPGGGHRYLTVEGEGRDPAEYLAKLGVTCFVLKYRLARDEGSPYADKSTLPQDGHRALRLVRSLADKYHLDPKRVGIIGFSAGGEVASLVAYNPGTGDPQATDPIERLSGRPDFQILIYPGGGGIPDAVAADAPPALMIVSSDDKSHVAPVVKVMELYRTAGAPFEVHILESGGHGYGLGQRSKSVAVQRWADRMGDWLADRGYLKSTEAK